MEASRRFRALGGVHAWAVPLFLAGVTAGALALGEGTAAACLGFLGLVVRATLRAVVIDVAPAGIGRLVTVGGAVLHSRVIAWDAVTDIATTWSRPGDCTALVTRVVGRDAVVTFSSRMGYATYRWCVEAVARRAPAARQSGLTRQLLAEPAGTASRPRLATALVLAVAVLMLLLAVST